MKQAVVLIHGIGEQKPMSTLRAFVSAVLPPAAAGKPQFRSKPDRMSELFELRRLTSTGRSSTDFMNTIGRTMSRARLCGICCSGSRGCSSDGPAMYLQGLRRFGGLPGSA